MAGHRAEMQAGRGRISKLENGLAEMMATKNALRDQLASFNSGPTCVPDLGRRSPAAWGAASGPLANVATASRGRIDEIVSAQKLRPKMSRSPIHPRACARDFPREALCAFLP